MSPTPSAPVLPSVDLVYTKTEAGRRELAQRSAALAARQRAALIMLDGRRDAHVQATLMPADQIAPVLATLIARGLIAPAATTESAPAPVPSPAPGQPALAAIKAELTHAAELYLGVMAGEVVARVAQAADGAALLRVLGHWHMALQDSKHGKEAARALLEKTRAMLAPAPASAQTSGLA